MSHFATSAHEAAGGCWTCRHAGAHHAGGIIACHHPEARRMHALPDSGCSAWQRLDGTDEEVKARAAARRVRITPWQPLAPADQASPTLQTLRGQLTT